MHPILIDFGAFKLTTYGTFVSLAYLAAILWLQSRRGDMPGMTEDKFWTMIYGLFFGAIAGGKLLYVAVEWREFAAGRLSLIGDFRYGFVFYGGVLGALAMGVWVQRRIKVSYAATADYFGVALPMGHALGRLGCLGAGCCYGRPTTLPWGVVLGGSPESSTPERWWGVPLHPTQVYESLANAAICLFLLKVLLPRAKRKELVPGTVFLAYVLLYSLARFVVEFYRGDDRGGFLLGLSVSQWIALAGDAGAAGLALRRGVRARRAR